jgi:hypothetical protein
LVKKGKKEGLIELACRARLAHIKQSKVKDIMKRMKPLGRKYLPLTASFCPRLLVILKSLAKVLPHYRSRARSIKKAPLLEAMRIITENLALRPTISFH